MKKKLFVLFMTVALTFSMAACGGKTDKPVDDGNQPGVVQGDEEQEKEDVTSGGSVEKPETPPADEEQEAEKPSTDAGNVAAKPVVKPVVKPVEKPVKPVTKPVTNPTKPAVKPVEKPTAGLSMKLEDIISKSYENAGELPSLAQTEVTAENAEYYLGSKDIKFKKALASEPMMSSVAHSVVVLEVEAGADMEDIKATIKKKVNPQKWVCVGVDPENVKVASNGNYIMLVMDNEAAQTIIDNFTALK